MSGEVFAHLPIGGLRRLSNISATIAQRTTGPNLIRRVLLSSHEDTENNSCVYRGRLAISRNFFHPRLFN